MIGTIMGSLALLAAIFCIVELRKETKRREEQRAAQIRYFEQTCQLVKNQINERLEKLEKGVIPDYEKATAATQALDNFNAGITGILGFDPFDALKAAREKENGGVIE